MSCRFSPTADGVARDLEVNGTGTWSNYSFYGALTSENERYRFASQNVTFAMAGVVRGFELSDASGQVAALSFWQTRKTTVMNELDPAAWIAAPADKPGLADVLAVTLALSYVYPWPTSCDTQRLRGKGFVSHESVDAGRVDAGSVDAGS